jgi:hypothetical protein
MTDYEAAAGHLSDDEIDTICRMIASGYGKGAFPTGDNDELMSWSDWFRGRIATALQEAADEALERAADACEEQAQVFLSTKYAVNQPLSSLSERFACGRCAEEIRDLKSPKGEE